MLTSLLLIAAIFFWFGSRIDRQIEESTHARMEEYAAQQEVYISTVLDSRYRMLSAFSTYFGDDLLSSPAAFQKLSRTLLQAGDFDHILTIDKDGNYCINTGETGQGNNPIGRQLLLSREQSISRPFRAFYHNNEQCVLFSVPLTDDEGNNAGMLCASYTAQRFARLLLQESHRESAFSLLTDAEGNLLFSSSSTHLFIPDSNSPADQRVVPSPSFFDEESSAAIRQSMARREDNLYTVTHDGVEYVLVQTPLAQNNWILFCMIPTHSLAADYDFITQLRHMQLLLISLILVLDALLLCARLLRDWRRLSRENSVLCVRASTDSMTGLLNQGTTSATIASELLAHGGEGVLLLLDLDNLKGINDTMGHPIGDRAILLLSEMMQDIFSDAAVIGRIGGDEFMIYLNKAGSRDDLRKRINLLRQQMNTAMKTRIDLPDELSLHCSVGAAYAKPGDDYASLYSRADIALYHVKRHGKDGYYFFEDIV